MRHFLRFLALATLCALGPAPLALAETATNVTFGGLRADTRLPVEINADSLSVNQQDGKALFSGNVQVSQGQMRLTAAEIEVEYAADSDQIARLLARGGVLIVNARDAAQADNAIYTIESGEVVMTGNVLLTQGAITLSAARMVINLATGLGRLEGGVKTRFQPEGGN